MHVMVKATRAEPGCVQYSFSFDVQDDHLLHIFEVFTDAAALAAHRASPHASSHLTRALPFPRGHRATVLGRRPGVARVARPALTERPRAAVS